MKFRCKQSKNIVEFFYDHDIQSMLTHPQYEVVEEKVKPQEEEKPKQKSKE